jgi:hypothetical protein
MAVLSVATCYDLSRFYEKVKALAENPKTIEK